MVESRPTISLLTRTHLMSGFIDQLQWLVTMSKLNFHLLVITLVGLWGIHLINFVLGYRLNLLGLLPRETPGLVGIIFAPLLHGNFSHLLFNSIPLFVLMNFLLLDGLANLIAVTIIIALFSGIAVWLAGRKALHIGASGIIMGYWGFLLLGAILSPSVLTVFLIVICLYYFGGFLSSLLPEEGSSWESHVFGFVAGLVASYFHLQNYIAPYITSLISS